MFPLRLCVGKLLVAVTRERHCGPSRLRVNDDDDDDDRRRDRELQFSLRAVNEALGRDEVGMTMWRCWRH